MAIQSFMGFIQKQDDLSEQAVAGYGDWQPNKDRLITKSLKQLNAEFEFVDHIMIDKITLDLYKMKNDDIFILGVKTDISFPVVFQIELKRRPDIASSFTHYKNLVNVDGVMVEKSMRGYGIAKTMYKYFVQKMKFTILGDEIQYHKARLTWASLSNMDDVLVDILDIEHNIVIETDVILHHGVSDEDFDDRVWDYGFDKKHIRLVLTKVL